MLGTHEALLRRILSHGLDDFKVGVQLDIESKSMEEFLLAEIAEEDGCTDPYLTANLSPLVNGARNALGRAIFLVLLGDSQATGEFVKASVYLGLANHRGSEYGGRSSLSLAHEARRKIEELLSNLYTYIELWLDRGIRLRKPGWSMSNV